MARGSAVTADDDEPAAVWFNPANLAFMDGVSASAGGVFITEQVELLARRRRPRHQHRARQLLPAGVVRERPAHRSRGRRAWASTPRSASASRWPDDWVGRESAINASLETLTLNPTVAVKVHRAGLGRGRVRRRPQRRRFHERPAGDHRRRRAAGRRHLGLRLQRRRALQDLPGPAARGAHLPQPGQAGLRHGRANFSPANPDFAPALPDQRGTASITLPDIITVGVMGRPRANLALTFDANLVLWSTYDRIDINFQSAPDRAIVPERPEHLHAARGRRLDVPGPLAGAAPARRPHLRSQRDPVEQPRPRPARRRSDRRRAGRRLRPRPFPWRPRLPAGRLSARRRHRRNGGAGRHVQHASPTSSA